MSIRDYHDGPEQNASTAFPITLLLLSIGAILAYLAIGGALTESQSEIVVFTPQVADVPTPH